MGSELEKIEKKKNQTRGLRRTGEQAKQGNELPKKVEFPSLELFWERGGTSLLQVV